MSVSGVMCGVMKNSNLALSGTNQITLELSTPHGVAPNGVLLCATADGHRFDRGTFVLNALEDGGSQFITGESTTRAGVAESDLLSVPALKGATSWNHRSVEVGVAADVLGLDARYSTSYARSRYDDLVTDIAGNVLDGLFQDPVWSVDAAARTAGESSVDIASRGAFLSKRAWSSRTPRSALAVIPPSAPIPAARTRALPCVVIAGR